MNYKLKSTILEVVDNQLQMNEPKCTKRTLNRLFDLGYSLEESKEMIASVLLEEMYYVMKDNIPFNEKQYAKKLSKLPDYSIEDESNNKVLPVKAAPSIGRNEPCQCGSGKKFKKCCGK